MVEKDVFMPVLSVATPPLRSHVFFKQKTDAEGNVTILKARLVADGSTQPDGEYGSPTVGLITIKILLAEAARRRLKVITADVGSAYLNALMDEPMYTILGPEVTASYVSMRPEHASYKRGDGSMMVMLKRALYGCRQSGRLWYKTFAEGLGRLGMSLTTADDCLFKAKNDDATFALIYVDDIIIMSDDDEKIDSIISGLKSMFKEVKTDKGERLSYLGMSLRVYPGSIEFGVPKLIQEMKMISKEENNITYKTPATANLFEITEGEELLPEKDKEMFHSQVAKALYVSARACPEVTTAISFLTTRVTKPTISDKKKLERVVNYLHFSPMTYRPSGQNELVIYTDASFAPHADLKSQSGLAVFYRGCLIHHSSRKQRLVSRSTAEAELIALSDAVEEIELASELIAEIGEMPRIIIKQDNEAVINLLRGGGGLKTKHLRIRQHVIAEWVKHNNASIEYCRSEEMIADIFTKPLQGQLFRKLRDALQSGKDFTSGGALVDRTPNHPNHEQNLPSLPKTTKSEESGKATEVNGYGGATREDTR